MKKIAVSVDFSPESTHSAQFAIEVAKKLNTAITFFHHYHLVKAHPSSEFHSHAYVPEQADREKELVKELEAFLDPTLFNCPVGYQIKPILGNYKDATSKMANSQEFGLMILQVDEANGIDVWLGNEASWSVDHLQVPLLFMPKNYGKPIFRKITVAADYQRMSDPGAILSTIREFGRAFESEIHFLHYYTEDFQSQKASENKRITEQLLAGVPHIYEEYPLKDKSIDKEILNYVESHKVDLIVLMPHRHTPLGDLFSRKITKRVVFHAPTALLVLPDR